MNASDAVAGFKTRHAVKRKRTNWKKEIKRERDKTIDEAIASIKGKMRNIPKGWERGYNSAITTLEVMKNE